MTRRNGDKAHSSGAFSMDAAQSLARLVVPLLRAQCVSVRQFTSILRTAAVQFEESRFGSKKVNDARVAFSTGLTRGTVSRLRRRVKPEPDSDIQSVIAAWRREASFLNQEGLPADLPIFGRGKTFERLAMGYGKGIPVRAILDELLDRGVVAIIPAQTVRLVESFPGAEYEFSARLASRLEIQANEALATRLRIEKLAANPRPDPRRTHFKRRRV